MDRLPQAVVLFSPGSDWDRTRPMREQRYAEEHEICLRQWKASGAAECAGPLWRPDEVVTGDHLGLVIANLHPGDAAELMLADNPAVRNGQIAAAVRPYYPLG